MGAEIDRPVVQVFLPVAGIASFCNLIIDVHDMISKVSCEIYFSYLKEKKWLRISWNRYTISLRQYKHMKIMI